MAMEQKAVLNETIPIGMADNTELLKKYTGKPYPPLRKVESSPALIKDDNDYQAVVEAKRGGRSLRFRIVDRAGVSYGCSYAHLLDWIFSPPALLTLNTTSRSFTLQGKNLGLIERLLMDDRVKELHCYNPEKHHPPEEGKPVIEKIEVNEY